MTIKDIRVWDTIQMATKSLWDHRLRTTLTILGVLIGNASFVSMVGVSQGARNYLLERLDSFGPNRVIVYSKPPKDAPFNAPITKLTLEDVYALAKGAEAIKAVAPQISSEIWINYKARTIKVSVIGTTFDSPVVNNSKVKTGRFFLPSEERLNEKVVVLGSDTSDQLFGSGQNPINQKVLLNNISFTVIGVMQPKGSFAKFNPDTSAFIPLQTLATRVLGRSGIKGIPIDYADISATSKDKVQAAVFQARNILRWRHGQEDFEIQTNKPFLDLILQVSTALTVFLGTVAGISLIVGGIGIMNVMLVSVSERTGEIGLRKAIGAKSSTILWQFLIEAIVLSTIGGAIGIILGFGGSSLISRFAPVKAPIPPWAVVLSLGISSGIGIVFGIAPARKASSLDPIQALRGE